MVGRSLLVLAAAAATAMLATLAPADAADATHGNIAVDIAGHKHLAGATALVNKNAVIHGNNIAVTKSNILARQDDVISLEAEGTEAAETDVKSEAAEKTEADGDEEASGASMMEIIEADEKEALTIPEDDGVSASSDKHLEFAPGYYGYRRRFYYGYGPRFRYGWRYPMPYWNVYGRGLYGAGCGYGRAFGGYYYC